MGFSLKLLHYRAASFRQVVDKLMHAHSAARFFYVMTAAQLITQGEGLGTRLVQSVFAHKKFTKRQSYKAS